MVESGWHPHPVQGTKILCLAMNQLLVDLFAFSLLPGHHLQPRAIYEPLHRPSWSKKYVRKHVCLFFKVEDQCSHQLHLRLPGKMKGRVGSGTDSCSTSNRE